MGPLLDGSPLRRPAPPRLNARRLTPGEVATLLRLAREDPYISYAELRRGLRKTLNQVSDSTLRRRLREAGLRSYRAAKKPRLTDMQKTDRLDFARLGTNWREVMFSDECTISTTNERGVKWVRRPRNKRFEEDYTRTVSRSGRISVAIWACFTYDGALHLYRVKDRLTGAQYKRRILQPYVAPYFRQPEHENHSFMHDNASVHTAVAVTRYLETQNIKTLRWPSGSPDLNPIENFWNLLKDEIGEIDIRAVRGNAEDKRQWLFEQTTEAWNRLQAGRGLVTIRRYYDSMEGRMQQVIEKRGGVTRY